MKTIQRLVIICLCLLTLLPSLEATPPPVVGFSVTPSVVSNTYNGFITLLITGLTNTETVVVQKYIDANGNGVLDPGEPLWQQFTLTDGTNSQIGGVTNFNVPGDMDTVPGQITTLINFQASSAQLISGNYLYVLSSPLNHFLPVTITFTVTNFPYPQHFTGNVLSNGVPVPYAGVILFSLSTNQDLNSVGGAIANGSGVYSIPAPPGLYALGAFQSNGVANLANAAYLQLNPGATLSTNLSLLPATEAISGKVQVANNPSLGLPGLLVPVQTKKGLLAVSVSDTNGNFTVGVTPNDWKVSVDSAAIAQVGCVGLQDNTVVDTTTNSVSGVPVSLYPATALFYGTVKDNFGNPLPGVVDVEANDTYLNIYQSDGFTDANGNFVVAALGGLGVDDLWWVQIGNNSSFPNYLFSQPIFDQFGGTNIAIGQAVPASMIAIIATNQISGHVQTSAGQAIAGVGVSASTTINGYAFNDYVDTDANGNYAFTVGNGIWSLSLNSQFGDDSLNAILGEGTFQFPASAYVGITNQNGVANFTVEPCDGIQIVTTNLPSGQVGAYYSFFLDGSTCSGQQSWSVGDPLDFPPNLSLSVNGQIQGNPTNIGTYHFTVQLSDNNGSVTNRSLTLLINSSGGSLQVATTTLPNGTVGIYYSQVLQFTGGQPPCRWTLSPGSAALPASLTLSTNGLLAGLPATNGTNYFSVRVTDSSNATADQPLTLVINHSVLQITTTTLTNATQNALYNTRLTATGGVSPYTWSLSPGSANPPSGISLATNGVLSGTPIGSGTASFIPVVTDATGTFTYQILSLTVTPSSLPQAIKLTLVPLPPPGTVQFSFKIAAGVSYTIQSSPDLKTWTDYQTFTFSNSNPTAGETWTATIPNPAGARQTFYRVKVGP